MKKNTWIAVATLLICSALLTLDCHSNNDKSAVSATDGNEVAVSDDASQFVTITDVVPDVILEIRYFGTYNFVGTRIDGYLEPTALLTRQAADSLRAVSDDVKSLGFRLKIYDAYRPQMGVDHFVRWAEDIPDTLMKSYFYPDLDKSVLFEQEYIYERSGHTRGSTVDLTLFDMQTEKELDMGGTFDWFGPESHPDFCGNPETGHYTGDNSKSPTGRSITAQQFANRMILRQAMLRHGFKALDTEWWHFTLKDEPYPNTYFTFPVKQLQNSAPPQQELQPKGTLDAPLHSDPNSVSLPQADRRASTGNGWVAALDMGGTGVHVESLYRLSSKPGSSNGVAVVLDPYLVQQTFIGHMGYTTDGDSITIYVDHKPVFSTKNTVTNMGGFDKDALWVGEQIRYDLNGSNPVVRVTPGVKFVTGLVLHYDDMPTLTATVTHDGKGNVKLTDIRISNDL